MTLSYELELVHVKLIHVPNINCAELMSLVKYMPPVLSYLTRFVVVSAGSACHIYFLEPTIDVELMHSRVVMPPVLSYLTLS